MRDSSQASLTAPSAEPPVVATAAGPIALDSATANPPRFWWLKRLTVSSLALAVVLAGVWYAWAGEARHRLARELEPLIAAGEPVNAAGMKAVRLPDAENGALLYRHAWTIMDRTVDSPANSQIDYEGYPPLPRRWHARTDRAIPKNGPALAAMREARGFRRFDWGINVISPAYGTLLPHLNHARELANLAGDAALYAHVHGDDAGAIEFVRDIRHEADAVNRMPTFLVTHLVAIGCEALALHRLEVIAPGLSIAPGDAAGEDGPAAPGTPPPAGHAATRPVARPATRAQVRALIAELLDESRRARGVRLAHAGEGAAELDMGEHFGRVAPVLRPMFELDAVRVARANKAVARAADEPNWQAAMKVLRTDPALAQVPAPQTALPGIIRGPRRGGGPPKRKPVDYTRFLASDVANITGIASGRGIEQDMKLRADRGLAAASLAVQLYRADHGGQFPPSLDALVPDYLPRLPLDPFRANGKPIGYVIARGALPDGGDRPLVYSVGPDGVDNTAAGQLAALPKTPSFGWQRTPDQWRDVSRWSPPLTPDGAKREAEMDKDAETMPLSFTLPPATQPVTTQPATRPATQRD